MPTHLPTPTSRPAPSDPKAAVPGAASAAVVRLLAVLVVAGVVLSVVPTPTAAVQAPTDPEARVLTLVNQERARMGRVALRWDSRLADVAQGRSDEMAASGKFGHLSWDVLTPRLAAKGITWSLLAEVLVLGTPRTPMESAEEAYVTWRNSKGHWDLLSSTEYNYVAFGVTRASNGWYYWTGLLIKGPDRTAPTASMDGARMGSAIDGRRSVTVSWSGADVPLSALTAGLHDFRLQRRVGSGQWRTITDWTRANTRTLTLTVGKTYRFRVRARDMAGNRSTWSVSITVTP